MVNDDDDDDLLHKYACLFLYFYSSVVRALVVKLRVSRADPGSSLAQGKNLFEFSVSCHWRFADVLLDSGSAKNKDSPSHFWLGRPEVIQYLGH